MEKGKKDKKKSFSTPSQIQMGRTNSFVVTIQER